MDVWEGTVHVALLLPFYDGSGETKLLGVFTNKVDAHARCHQEIVDQGYAQPTDVIECLLNVPT